MVPDVVIPEVVLPQLEGVAHQALDPAPVGDVGHRAHPGVHDHGGGGGGLPRLASKIIS